MTVDLGAVVDSSVSFHLNQNWQAPSLQNSWVNYGGSLQASGYTLIGGANGGIVALRGSIKDGTATDGTLLFTLASGYRPAAEIWTPLQSSHSLCHVQAYRSSTQSIGSGSLADVIFSTENVDDGSDYDNATGIFTAPTAGYYSVSWCISWESTAWTAGQIQYSLLSKNNSTSAGSCWRGDFVETDANVTKFENSPGSAFLKLASSDTLRVKAYQNTGGAINLEALGPGNFFHIHRIVDVVPQLKIEADGSVKCYYLTENARVSFDGITFSTES
jgi:hypothetical protein